MKKSWRPTKSEAGLLIDMLTSCVLKAKIAEHFGIEVAILRNYLARLSAAVDVPYPDFSPPPPSRPAPTSRMRAETYFDVLE